MRKFMCVLLTICILAVAGWNMWDMVQTEQHGGVNFTCHVSPEGQTWIRQQFGGCETMESLVSAITDYADAHFTYVDYESDPLLQEFRFEEFLATGQGVCWEFSAFGKCCVMEWANMKGLTVKNYCASVTLDKDPEQHHSYNYVILDGTIHHFDLTVAVCSDGRLQECFSGTREADVLSHIEANGDGFARFR